MTDVPPLPPLPPLDPETPDDSGGPHPDEAPADPKPIPPPA